MRKKETEWVGGRLPRVRPASTNKDVKVKEETLSWGSRRHPMPSSHWLALSIERQHTVERGRLAFGATGRPETEFDLLPCFCRSERHIVPPARPPARRYSVIIVFIVGTPWKLGYPSRNIKRRTGRCRAAAPRIESTVFFSFLFLRWQHSSFSTQYWGHTSRRRVTILCRGQPGRRHFPLKVNKSPNPWRIHTRTDVYDVSNLFIPGFCGTDRPLE